MLSACAPSQVMDFDADRNTARNQAILWLLWDTGIRLRELCGLRLSDFDRRQGTIIVFGKGRKERRVALGRNALRALLYYMDRWRQDAPELEESGNADEDHIFLAETGHALTTQGIQMLFKRLRRRYLDLALARKSLLVILDVQMGRRCRSLLRSVMGRSEASCIHVPQRGEAWLSYSISSTTRESMVS